LASFSDSSSDEVRIEGCRATVMSAPTLVSRNGESGCFTDTTAEPFGFSLDDHDISAAAPGCGTRRAFDAGLVVRVEASTLSWLQSSSFPSAAFVSQSFVPESPAAHSAAAASGLSADGRA